MPVNAPPDLHRETIHQILLYCRLDADGCFLQGDPAELQRALGTYTTILAVMSGRLSEHEDGYWWQQEYAENQVGIAKVHAVWQNFGMAERFLKDALVGVVKYLRRQNVFANDHHARLVAIAQILLQDVLLVGDRCINRAWHVVHWLSVDDAAADVENVMARREDEAVSDEQLLATYDFLAISCYHTASVDRYGQHGVHAEAATRAGRRHLPQWAGSSFRDWPFCCPAT